MSRLVSPAAAILLPVLFLTGCVTCARKAKNLTPIRDHLETYVIVSIGHSSCCPIPWQDKPLVIKTNKLASFWIRAVHPDNLFDPEPGKVLKYSLINEFGEVASSGTPFSGEVTTDGQGYAMLQSLKPSIIGVYRLRVEYQDRNLIAVSLSQPIIVK